MKRMTFKLPIKDSSVWHKTDCLEKPFVSTSSVSTMNKLRSRSIGDVMVKEAPNTGPLIKPYYDSVLELIGNTPLVKLQKVPKDHNTECNIFAKCEFLNPGGSVKDRIAYAMYLDALNKGEINENSHFVEPSSGNTGIGIAMMAALNGKTCSIVTCDKNSNEKTGTLRLLGADVIQTRDGIDMEVARAFKDKDPNNVIMLNQVSGYLPNHVTEKLERYFKLQTSFENKINPWIHHKTTGVEIASSLDKIDMIVMGAGSGGTITGVTKEIKEKFPKCLIVAAEPDGSTQIDHNLEYHPFLVEGIGGRDPAANLDTSVIDYYTTATDKESFLMARELAKKEGLMCGGSSGTAMTVAIKAAEHFEFGPEHNIVVVFPDGIRNYMTKFVSNQWMEAHLFQPLPDFKMTWWNDPATNLKHDKYPMVNKDLDCSTALERMRAKNATLALVVDDQNRYVGIVTKDYFRRRIVNPNTTPDESILHDFRFSDPASDHLVKEAITMDVTKASTTVGLVSRTLDATDHVVLGKSCSLYRGCFRAQFVVTGDMVLEYIYERETNSVK